jgi:GDSL-like Lipase/Acylhydrolase
VGQFSTGTGNVIETWWCKHLPPKLIREQGSLLRYDHVHRNVIGLGVNRQKRFCLPSSRPGDLASSPATKLYRLDVAAMAERARTDAASYGFTNITTPCHASNQCEKCLFWDDIHPTTAAHARLSEGALRILSLQQVR